MKGYALSPKAAAAEARYASSRGAALETKSVMSFPGLAEGRQDGNNFRTNQITTQAYDDARVLSENAALGLSATYACTAFWSGNIASLPLMVYRAGPKGVDVPARDHPLFWLLHDSPNYDQSAFEFMEYLSACLEIRGHFFAEMVFRGGGFLVSLTPLGPDQVTFSRNKSGRLDYRVTEEGRTRIVAQDQMLHVRGPFGGLSPLAVCRRTFQAALATDSAASSMFNNGVRPSGVLSTDAMLTPEQHDRIEVRMQEKFAGAFNAGRPLVLDNKMAWHQVTIDPSDAQMLESRKFSVEDICRVFEVDPHLVGHTEGNTNLGSSIGDQTLSLLKFKLHKRLKRIEGAFEKQLLSRADRQAGVSIKFNLEGFLRADSLGRAQYYNIMRQFYTTNEVRALEGMPPVDGGDVLMVQMQDVPLAQAQAGASEKPA